MANSEKITFVNFFQILVILHTNATQKLGHCLKSIHSRPDTSRTGAESLSFYYPRLLHCLNQVLAVMLLSQHRVSSSKTVRPRAPCGARCIGHAVSTWSAVCSEAPHSQFGEGARPHLCMDEWNRPTPVRRRLSLTQAAQGKPIPTGLTLVPGTEPGSIGPDGRCFFAAWAVSKSVHCCLNDRPKPNLPKRKGIHPFRCSVWVC